MKNKLKFLIFAIIFTIILGTSAAPVSAISMYPENLRVGIYYGSGTISSLNLQSAEGFSVGFTFDRYLFHYDTLSNTAVTVSRVPAGTFYIQYAACPTAEEMTTTLTTLRNQGVEAFTAYINGLNCVLGGCFATEADANAQIQSSGASATAVAASANALQLTDTASGKILFFTDFPYGNLTVHSKNTQNPDSLLTISGSAKGTYRGGFECSIASDGKLAVTNVVPTEWYLYSVVCREMSPSWPIEALKAQSVCARTFAMRSTKHKKAYNFDVCTTTCCQVYSSTADMSKSIHTAVDGTKGQVLFYNDSLIEAVYSSSAGSATASSKNVWGGDIPYLVSVENPYENTSNIPKGTWSNTITGARATEIMSKYGIGTVTDISAIEYSSDGRVTKLKVTGTNGEKIFERDSCRNAFSEATLSQKYTITKNGTSALPTAYATTTSGNVQITLDNVSVISGTNTVQNISGNCTAFDGNLKTAYTPASEGTVPDSYTFSGEGWGHGVGMSQYGAKGMDEAGFDYVAILTHYFTGAQLYQVY